MVEKQIEIESKLDKSIKDHRDMATMHARNYAKNENPDERNHFFHHENIANILSSLKEDIIEIFEK